MLKGAFAPFIFRIMKKFFTLFIILAIIISSFTLSSCSKSPKKYTDYSFDFFDTVTTIVGFEQTQEDFDNNCEKIKNWLLEYHRLYDIYTLYDGINNLCKINTSQGQEISVDEKIIDLLSYSKKLYEKTNGKLNIAMGSVLSIWHDCREYGLKNPDKAYLPSEELLKTASNHTDINKLVININDNTVCFADDKMKLDVGGIAKGFATQKIAEKMEEHGIIGYILNIGGNVKIVGERPDGQKWNVGIENPDTIDTENPYIEQLQLDNNMSLVTSGSYQRFYTVNGNNYHHIINPDTLYPAQNFKSVSVLCENSGLADALSTALFCMSYEDGKELIAQTEGVYVMWVTENGEKLYSKGFENFFKN